MPPEDVPPDVPLDEFPPLVPPDVLLLLA